MDIIEIKIDVEETELAKLVHACVNAHDESSRQRSYTLFYNECRNVYTSILYGLTLNDDLAETIYNDAVLIFFEKARSGVQIDNIKGFLYQVAKNVYLNKIKPERKYAARFSFLEGENKKMDGYLEPEFENLDLNSEEVKLKNAMDELRKLKPDQERVLRAFYIDEMTYKQVSETMGYSINEVKTHVQNGKNSLAKLLKPNKL